MSTNIDDIDSQSVEQTNTQSTHYQNQQNPQPELGSVIQLSSPFSDIPNSSTSERKTTNLPRSKTEPKNQETSNLIQPLPQNEKQIRLQERLQAEEKYRQKKLKNEIKDKLFALVLLKDQCQPENIADFLLQYRDQEEILNRALKEFGRSYIPTIQIIQEYVNTEPNLEIEAYIVHEQSRRVVMQQVERLQNRLPQILMIEVSIDETGPQLQLLDKEKFTKVIELFLQGETIPFNVHIPDHFPKIGYYDIQIEFAEQVSIFQHILLHPPFSQIPSEFLLKSDQSKFQLPDLPNDTNNIFDYVDKTYNDFSLDLGDLESLLQVVYNYGYGCTILAQQIRQSWQQKQDALLVTETNNLSLKESTLIITKILELAPGMNRTPFTSSADSEMNSAVTYLQREIRQCDISSLRVEDAPKNALELPAFVMQGQHSTEVQIYLKLCRYYSDLGLEEHLRVCIAEYTFMRALELYNSSKRDCRLYILCFLRSYSRFNLDLERVYRSRLYHALAMYFSIRKIDTIDVTHVTNPEMENRFVSRLDTGLQNAASRKQYVAIGRTLQEVTLANHKLVFHLLGRLHDRQQKQALMIFVQGLQKSDVVRFDPLLTITLLGRIKPDAIADSLREINFKETSINRPLAAALVSFARSEDDFARLITHHFGSGLPGHKRVNLIFALFVIRYFLKNPREGEIKASLIIELLDLSADDRIGQFLLAAGSELATFFDRFDRTTEANTRAEIAFTILNKIALLRKGLFNTEEFGVLDNTTRNIINEFTNSLQGYVTSEQNKLIHEASLEVLLLSERVVHTESISIKIEIRHMGANKGLIEQLEVIVFSVENQYDIDEYYRVSVIDLEKQRLPIQHEIIIKPLVVQRDSIDLDIRIRYDTLKDKNKEAHLQKNNCTIYLSPEGQYKPVPSEYNTSQPATTWFYGRQKLLESMVSKLRQGDDNDSSIMLYGLKRTGKTSLLKRFLNQTMKEYFLQEKYLTIELELLLDRNRFLHPKMNNGDFLYWLVTKIIEKINNLETMKQISQEEISKINSIYINEDVFLKDPYATFTSIIKQMTLFLGERRIIIALDEFSVLNDFIQSPDKPYGLTSEVFSFLSNTIQHNKQLTFIFAGTYVLLEMNRKVLFDLTKICVPQLVSFLDESSARDLIIKPVQFNPNKPDRGWLEYKNDVINDIVKITNCHPYFIQYLCLMLVDRMNDLKESTAYHYDLNKVLEDFTYKPAQSAVIEPIWNEMKLVHQKILSIIAHASADQSPVINLTTEQSPRVSLLDIQNVFESFGESISVIELRTVCTSLVEAQMLTRIFDAKDELYEISIQLFYLWMNRNRHPSEVFGKELIRG